MSLHHWITGWAMIHVSAKHKVIGVPATPALVNLFPAAKRAHFNGQDLVILPHGAKETKMLRNLGFDAPSPILSYYHFPHPPGEKPYEVQRLTASVLSTNQRAYNLNGMGTGKTRTTMWAFDFLKSCGLAHRMLVVAPLSTLNTVWGRECLRNFPHLTYQVLHGRADKRLTSLGNPADVYIVNPDGLEILSDALDARRDIDVVVLDELATYRNGRTVRNTLARRLVRPRTWAWGLTGAPTPEAPTDAWGQCQILTPNSVEKYFTRFRDRLMLKVSPFRYVPRADSLQAVHNAMQPSVRFTLDDIVELPEIIERQTDVEMGAKQLKIYEQLRQHARVQIDNGEITAVNAGVVLNKLLQISMGYVYKSDHTTVALDNDKRLQALVDIIESTDHKAIVFAPYRHALQGIYDALKKAKIDVHMVHGDISKATRDETYLMFQSTDKPRVIAADPRTMSHGLTLTAADTIVWFGPYASLETFEQANARIRRLGQKHKHQILMLQSTAVERKIYARLRQKQKVQDNLLELFEDQELT